MRPLRRVLFVLAAFAAVHGVQACTSETPDPGLNPQPLPPEDQKDNTRDPEAAQDPAGGGSTSSGSSSGGATGGSSGSTAPNDGDAGDGGDAGGDE